MEPQIKPPYHSAAPAVGSHFAVANNRSVPQKGDIASRLQFEEAERVRFSSSSRSSTDLWWNGEGSIVAYFCPPVDQLTVTRLLQIRTRQRFFL